MPRHLPILLGLWAALGLLLPRALCVHAHADGHDDHHHGAGHGLHSPLSASAVGAPPTASEDAAMHPVGEDPLEHHVHGGGHVGTAARTRPKAAASGTGSSPPFASPLPWVLASRPQAAELREGSNHGPRARPPARALETLLPTGRLRI